MVGKKLYVLRHCSSMDGTDCSVLDTLGKMQAYLLSHALSNKGICKCLYTGAASRETAQALYKYNCIKTESLASFSSENLYSICESEADTIAVCTGKENICSLLSQLMVLPAAKKGYIIQPYSCINIVNTDDALWNVISFGEEPHIELSHYDCISLLEIAGKSKDEILLAEKTESTAASIACALLGSGFTIDRHFLSVAALLCELSDDLKQCADWVDVMGYRIAAESIRSSRRLSDCDMNTISEKVLLFLALRLRDGDIRSYLETASAGDREQTELIYEIVMTAIKHNKGI